MSAVAAILTLIGVVAWLALGYIGWANGDAYFRRKYTILGDKAGAEALLFTAILGPFNLITFVMWGWNLGERGQ